MVSGFLSCISRTQGQLQLSKVIITCVGLHNSAMSSTTRVRYACPRSSVPSSSNRPTMRSPSVFGWISLIIFRDSPNSAIFCRSLRSSKSKTILTSKLVRSCCLTKGADNFSNGSRVLWIEALNDSSVVLFTTVTESSPILNFGSPILSAVLSELQV